MENASKALLIVAAILVVIILVAFGVKVLNSTSGSKDAAITIGESISATAFNSRIKRYAGANKSANEVVELLDIVLANNEKGNRKIYVTQITLNANGPYLRIEDHIHANSERIQRYKQTIKAHKTVNVYVYYASDGYIRAIGYELHGKEYKADYNSQLGW